MKESRQLRPQTERGSNLESRSDVSGSEYPSGRQIPTESDSRPLAALELGWTTIQSLHDSARMEPSTPFSEYVEATCSKALDELRMLWKPPVNPAKILPTPPRKTPAFRPESNP